MIEIEGLDLCTYMCVWRGLVVFRQACSVRDSGRVKAALDLYNQIIRGDDSRQAVHRLGQALSIKFQM